MTVSLILLALFVAYLIALASWTAASASIVLTLLAGHTVVLGWFLGLLLNAVSGGFAVPFDVIVTVLHSVSVI